MADFDDYDFDAFDALDFEEFDALDGMEYPASFYNPDLRASTIGSCLDFLTVYPRADHEVSAADRLQAAGLYRGIAAASPTNVAWDEGHLLGGIMTLTGGMG
jgi:hypothetical protein